MIPSSLLTEQPYRQLPGESKLLYGHLLGLLRLSAQDTTGHWKANGRPCVSLSRASAGRLLHCQREKAAGLFAALERCGLLEQVPGQSNGKPGGITSICPGPRNPTSCNHPSGNPSRPVGKTDRQLTDLPTPTRRKNRHDKDRMIYLTKREIEKEFHTPRFEKSGQELWCLVSRGNHRLDNRYDGGSTGRWHSDFGWQPVFQSLPPQRAHWHFAGSAGKCIVGQMLSKASAYPIRSRTVPKKGVAYQQNPSDCGAQ